MPNGTYERIKKFSDTLPLRMDLLANGWHQCQNLCHNHPHFQLSIIPIISAPTFSDKHVSRTALNKCPSEPPLLSKLQKRRQERNGKSNRLSKFVKQEQQQHQK